MLKQAANELSELKTIELFGFIYFRVLKQLTLRVSASENLCAASKATTSSPAPKAFTYNLSGRLSWPNKTSDKIKSRVGPVRVEFELFVGRPINRKRCKRLGD